MKRILITGANSYIGTSFEDYMKQWSDEYEIDTVDMIGGTWREKDFSKYDVVFHVAGIAHIKETKQNKELYYKVNRDLAIEVAQKAKYDRIKQFIFLSSMSVYGMNTGVITKETNEQPKSAYGKSKLEAEKGIYALKNDEYKVCILRPPMIYGKGCKGNYVTLSKYAKKLPIFPDIENQRSMLYVENLCEFIRMMIVNEEMGTFMPQNAEYTKTSEMVRMIAEVSGKKIRMVRCFNPLLRIGAKFVGVVDKVFGNLTYDMELTTYKEAYNAVKILQSIEQTENA